MFSFPFPMVLCSIVHVSFQKDSKWRTATLGGWLLVFLLLLISRKKEKARQLCSAPSITSPGIIQTLWGCLRFIINFLRKKKSNLQQKILFIILFIVFTALMQTPLMPIISGKIPWLGVRGRRRGDSRKQWEGSKEGQREWESLHA